MNNEEFERRREWFRDGKKQYELDHPEVVEIARLQKGLIQVLSELREN